MTDASFTSPSRPKPGLKAGLKRVDVLTLFPQMFEQVLGSSILKRAATTITNPADPNDIRPPVVSYHLHNIRDYSTDKHDKVDKPPYGGGPGMVIQCQPTWDCMQAVLNQDADLPVTPILMSPAGRRLDQRLVEDIASKPRIAVLCGHYEGFDQRVIDKMRDELGLIEVSIGDYVLSGGETAAMVVIDAAVRLQPGVLGDAASAVNESFSTDLNGGLDYPHYTRPPTWDDRPVPAELLSGNHKQIDAWRIAQSQSLTQTKRPDLSDAANSAASNGSWIIRPEREADFSAINQLLTQHFPTGAEAKITRTLKAQNKAPCRLVATTTPAPGSIVPRTTAPGSTTPGSNTPASVPGTASIDTHCIAGYLLCSPVHITQSDNNQPMPRQASYWAIAPLTASTPQLAQLLIQEAIAWAEEEGVSGLLMQANPNHWADTGFKPIQELGIQTDSSAPPSDQPTLILNLDTRHQSIQALANTTAQYLPVFAQAFADADNNH